MTRMASNASPENWTVSATRDGFVLVDVWGEEIDGIAFTSWADAISYRNEQSVAFYDNYEPTEAELVASLNLGGESGNDRLARQMAEARNLK